MPGQAAPPASESRLQDLARLRKEKVSIRHFLNAQCRDARDTFLGVSPVE